MQVAELVPFTSEMLKTHNGEITITSPKGGHRTFRIRASKFKSKVEVNGKLEEKIEVKRVLSLLIGPDNERSYKGFAFVLDDGSIVVWKKQRGGQFDTYAHLLATTAAMQERGYGFLLAGTCCKCNRKLTNPTSIQSGIGPECAKRA